jgi:hypothetical protein
MAFEKGELREGVADGTNFGFGQESLLFKCRNI